MSQITVERLEDGVWVPRVEEYPVETDMPTDPDNLDFEACHIGKRMLLYGELMAHMRSEFERKKEYTVLVQATVSAHYRQEAATEGKKLTVDALKEKVTLDEQVQQALAVQFEAEKNRLLSENWWRLVQKKADLIQTLIYRATSEIKRGAF